MGCYCPWRCEAIDFGRCKQNTVNSLEITKPALSVHLCPRFCMFQVCSTLLAAKFLHFRQSTFLHMASTIGESGWGIVVLLHEKGIACVLMIDYSRYINHPGNWRLNESDLPHLLNLERPVEPLPPPLNLESPPPLNFERPVEFISQTLTRMKHMQPDQTIPVFVQSCWASGSISNYTALIYAAWNSVVCS